MNARRRRLGNYGAEGPGQGTKKGSDQGFRMYSLNHEFSMTPEYGDFGAVFHQFHGFLISLF